MLICTYRGDEVQPTLCHLLATLSRERLAQSFTLPPLELPQVEAVIRAIFAYPQPVRSEFVERLHHLTDGNPFFVEEVLKALVSVGDIFYAGGAWTRKAMSELDLPPTVQDAVERRTQQLSPAAHHLLMLASVVGRHCDFNLLQQLSQQEEATLLQLIKELIAAQLWVEEADDHFVFRHALTRQAIYNRLLGRERRTLHRAVLKVLEATEDTESLIVAKIAANLNLNEAEGWHMLKEEAFKDALYADCSAEDVALARALLTPEPNAPVGTPLQLSAENFGRIPRVYIETLQDKGVTPGIQKKMYTATTCQQVLSLNTSHSPFLSSPQSLVEHLLTAAEVTTTAGVVRVGL